MRNRSISDSQLVSQFLLGREGAFDVLTQRHQSRVYTAIYLIVRDRYVAEDLLQETFIKALKTLREGKYNDEGKFLPWISRIAHNLAIDHFRKDRRYPHIVLKDGSPVLNSMKFSESSAESVQISGENRTWVRTCILELPKEQREVLIMRHYLDMSFQEIADKTGVSINTALGRMRYALINMRKKMKINTDAYDKNLYSKRPDQVSLPGDYGGGEP
jgi:RNA polymerase sigma-70 factor (ECF subfamily)